MMALQQNQLLFNLDMPSMPVNIASKFHKPDPIVIEKFGSSSGPIITAPKTALQFSAISQESLSQAVQLAKRDLKKQKEESFIASQQKKTKSNVRNATKASRTQGRIQGHTQSRTKSVHGQEHTERSRRMEDKKKQANSRAILMKERERAWNVKTTKTQTSNPGNAHNNRVPGRRMIPDMPAMSMSPPTRDTHSDLTQLSGDTRTLAEIRRLREDMDSCLHKIHQVHEAARNNPSMWRQDNLVYAEDIETENKRSMRREEHATRSARTIYQLNQQVRFIQDEINNIGPANIKDTKKSQILSRLAAVHRGSVRALQNFIQHLPDCDLTEGLPRSYHELALLLRQLSLCCTQLEVAGQTGVPDSVLTLLNDYAEMNKVLDQHSSPKSPPRHCQVTKHVQDNKKTSPVSRRLEFAPTVPSRQQTLRGEVKSGGDIKKQGPLTIDRVKHSTDRGVDATPDRQSSLRAGIAALMRAGNSMPTSPRQPTHHKSPVPPLDLPVTPRTPRGVAWEYPLEKPKLQQFKAGQKKGLLLPSKLREKRRKVQKPRTVVPSGDTHYAAPTKSSRLKEIPPEERLVIHAAPLSPRPTRKEPDDVRRPRSSSLPGAPSIYNRQRSTSPYSTPRSPGLSSYGTPRSSSLHARSPYGTPRSPGPHARSPYGTPRSPGGRDIIRQVQMDRENALRDTERAKIDRLRKELGQPEEWVQRAEDKIRERLQPLLDQAQDILEAYRSVHQDDRGASYTSLSPYDASLDQHSVEVNADLLADSLLGDLLEDTARHIGHGDADISAEYKAAAMQDAPSMETMLQSLHNMEMEQQEIRRRWATLVYEEENTDISARARYFDAPSSDQPGTPTPIHLTSKLPDINQTLLPDSVLARLESNPTDEGAILFTKPAPAQPQLSSLHLSQLDGAMYIRPEPTHTKPGIPIVLSEEVLHSIESHKKEFEQYLKKNSYHSVGRFNPWIIVEEVASEILDDCLRDVSKELEEINNDIVTQVYSGEFKGIPSPVVHPVQTSLQADHAHTSVLPHTATRSHIPQQHTDSEQLHGDTNQIGESVGQNSQVHDEAVPSSVRSPSPDPASANYSYEDDFVESSMREKTRDDVSHKSDYSEDSWKTND